MTKLWNSAVFVVLSCRPLSEALELSKERWLVFPGVRCTPSHPSCRCALPVCMWKQVWWQDSEGLSGFACTVAHLLMTKLWEAAPQWTDVIKHSKPTGWQQAHFLAPGLSVEKETCLMLCFPAQWNPTREERYKRKRVWFWGQIQCISTDSQRNFSILCFSGVNVNLKDTLGILTHRWLFLWRLTLVLTGLFKF